MTMMQETKISSEDTTIRKTASDLGMGLVFIYCVCLGRSIIPFSSRRGKLHVSQLKRHEPLGMWHLLPLSIPGREDTKNAINQLCEDYYEIELL
jgi:hypothetical protein